MSKIVKSSAFFVVLLLFQSFFVIFFTGCKRPPQPDTPPADDEKVVIKFEITQDLETISLSLFGEPPQFAIWLEDAVTGDFQTVYVTYRSGTGDWEGKADCPAALPRWFQIYKQESNTTTLPTMDNPVPDAITGATPTQQQFRAGAQVPAGSRWICWIEMNLSGDFNHKYQEYNEIEQTVDWHFSGQPPLIYRAEITAIPSQTASAKLFGQSIPYSTAENIIEPVSEDITSAKDVFKSIEIRVLPAETAVNKEI